MASVPETSNAPPHYNIYTGVWTDWSHNRIIGSTLTTTRAHGNLLIAFLSLFVAVVGTSFWRICCFVLHYLYSTEVPRDAMYHQRQSVLRNAANATTGITALFQVLSAWREAHPKISYRRILPLLLFSCFILTAFGVASTFSSRLSTIAGNAVLISNNNCGFMYGLANPNFTDFATVFNRYIAQKTTSNAHYAEQCYPKDHAIEGCSTFIQQRLSTTVTADAPCPFSDNICKSRNANIILDTGLMDSHYHLGLNAPINRRYQVRLVLQAAPLKTEGYKQFDRTDSTLKDPYARYYYGTFTNNGLFYANFTYQHGMPKREQYLGLNFTGPHPDMDVRYVTDFDFPWHHLADHLQYTHRSVRKWFRPSTVLNYGTDQGA